MKFFRYILLSLSFFILPLYAAEKVTLLAEDAWYPYTGKTDTQSVAGIAVDLITAAFEEVDTVVEYKVVPYDRAMAKVRKGEAIACFNTPREPNVEAFYKWPEQRLYQAKSFYYARKNFVGEIKSVKDLAKRKVGLVQGYGYGNDIDNNTQMHKVFSSSDKISIRKLMAKRVDVIVVFEMVAKHLLSQMPEGKNIKVVGQTKLTDIYLAFSKKHPNSDKYIFLFNKGFAKIKQNGRWQKIIDTWQQRFD